MSDQSNYATEYMQQVIAWQPRLYSFILSLVGNRNESEDVLQNANMVLLQEQKTFQHGGNFGAWAMKIAYHQVLHHRTVNKRASQRFDSVLLDQLAEKLSASNTEPSIELRFLHDCTMRLSQTERELIGLRYAGNSVQHLAKSLGRTAGSISQTLYRIRVKLADCVKRSLSLENRDDS